MSSISKLRQSPLWGPNQRHKTLYKKRNICKTLISIIILTFIQNHYRLTTNNLNNSKNDKNSYNNDSRCQILTNSTPNQLSTLTTLNLKSCSLTGTLPSTIRHATNLLQLDISNNPGLTSLTSDPADFQSLHKLEIFFASSNVGIRLLPPVLGTMPSITRLGWRDGSLAGEIDAGSIPPNLVHLILTNNKIEKFDGKNLFRRLKSVRKLMLSHNRITSFGSDDGEGTNDVSQLINLELLRIAGNKLTYLAPAIWTLPKLTWLTISGNPLLNKNPPRTVPQIDITSLTDPPIITKLGEGASGQVRTYLYRGNEVAVKILHGVTSDGRAEDELAIYGMVGGEGKLHRVVGCIGTLLDGEKEMGIVMERLPSGLDDLADPPTIVEVTKDRWDGAEHGSGVFSSSFVLNTLGDVVEALMYLHGKVGVAHGDVYAHNMKVDRKTGRLFLLDFGAAYVVGKYAIEAERLEVRAVGVLIGELFDRMVVREGHSMKLRKSLVKLRDRCVDGNVTNRPTLREVHTNLSQLRTLIA